VPGGLFEVAVLPIWLIVKGFSAAQPAEDPVLPALATSG
jgi:hypothetical protein